ncbi:MAG: hypothetical protein N3G18_07575 [Candidatus Saccharicenans sp.]|nr:hypothetical protein [Candidatus Saccharicenans sp.]
MTKFLSLSAGVRACAGDYGAVISLMVIMASPYLVYLLVVA